MPTVPYGNAILPTIMLAEKIADAIKSNDKQFPNIFLEDKNTI
jgi:choline dehydrogenase-like flavoprotein